MGAFDLEAWLRAHSVSAERVGSELVFTHFTGETSILLPRSGRESGLLDAKTEPIAAFYARFLGASIGNSQLVFATSVVGGAPVSRGFSLPDFVQLGEHARESGIEIGGTEQAFLAEAAWMFIYTVDARDGCLRMYDQDFAEVREVESLESVMEAWWGMVLTERRTS